MGIDYNLYPARLVNGKPEILYDVLDVNSFRHDFFFEVFMNKNMIQQINKAVGFNINTDFYTKVNDADFGGLNNNKNYYADPTEILKTLASIKEIFKDNPKEFLNISIKSANCFIKEMIRVCKYAIKNKLVVKGVIG
jgi:hypothetical protein